VSASGVFGSAANQVTQKAAKPHYIAMMLLCTVIVVAGEWKEGKGLSIKTVLGFFGVSIMLSLIAESSDSLADGFSYLILASACFKYLPELFDGKPGKAEPTPKQSKGTSGVTGSGTTTGSGHGSDALGGGSVPAIDKLPPNLGKTAKGLGGFHYGS
jgi:hypothetical protein